MTENQDSPVVYSTTGPVAVLSLNRPQYRNAQNSAVTYALDAAFHRAAMDDSIAVIVLRGNGEHFSAGHDIGSPGRDIDVSFPRVTMWPDHVGKPGIESRLNRESEVYLELVRRWRDIPKPTIAAVQGACIAGALMLVWACDLIVAADNAFFADPVLRMGAPGVEYFAHPWQMGPRFAKEFLFLGERVGAVRARELGMVNRVVPLEDLDSTVMEMAGKIAGMPRMALALTKKAVNFAEDEMGLRAGIDHSFALHQLAHASSAEVSGGDAILGATPASLKQADQT
ncbi:MAG: enoyl-CoA hydratase [Candidatus Dormibacteria bacterium]